jgi:hypothetical protein
MFSGGKDSLMALWFAAEVHGLKTLAVTVDNGFIPDDVFANIRRATESLAVKSTVVRAELPQQIFRAFLRSEARKRVSVCSFCNRIRGAYYRAINELVVEHKIPLIIDGRSKLGSDVGREFPGLIEQGQQIERFLARYRAERDLDQGIVQGRQAPWLWLSPWLYLRRDHRTQGKFLEQRFGWRPPNGSWPGNTSSCRLSLLDGYLCRRHGISDNPHEHELSLEIRWGETTRDVALQRFGAPIPEAQAGALAQEFGLELDQL